MVDRLVRIGSMEDIHQYDDADYDSAIETDQPIKAGAPVDPNDVLRLADLPVVATMVTAAAVIADHAIVRGDGGARGIQDSPVTIDDAGRIYSPQEINTNNKVKFTTLGGLAIALTNKTGAVSVAGQVVRADTANSDAVILTGVSEQESIGVFLDSGIADGAEAWIVISGIVDIAMEDNTTATRGNWVYASAEAGYANATLAAPPGGGIVQIDQHMQELGHCIESVAATGAGTHISARCIMHFN